MLKKKLACFSGTSSMSVSVCDSAQFQSRSIEEELWNERLTDDWGEGGGERFRRIHPNIWMMLDWGGLFRRINQNILEETAANTKWTPFNITHTFMHTYKTKTTNIKRRTRRINTRGNICEEKNKFVYNIVCGTLSQIYKVSARSRLCRRGGKYNICSHQRRRVQYNNEIHEYNIYSLYRERSGILSTENILVWRIIIRFILKCCWEIIIYFDLFLLVGGAQSVLCISNV